MVMLDTILRFYIHHANMLTEALKPSGERPLKSSSDGLLWRQLQVSAEVYRHVFTPH